ncbi:MAG: hypothetical protein ACFB00_09845 [Parvularculaceae bacterium]
MTSTEKPWAARALGAVAFFAAARAAGPIGAQSPLAPAGGVWAWSAAAGDAVEPNGRDGRPIVQLGVGAMQFYSHENALIDQLKESAWGNMRVILPDYSRREFDWMLDNGYFDVARQAVRKTPDGGSVSFGYVKFSSTLAPAGFFGREWVVDWAGDGDIELWSRDKRFETRRVGRNRLEATFHPEHRESFQIRLTRVGDEPVSRVRAYERSREDALNRGEIFREAFVERVRPFKVLRPMDWSRVNGSTVTRVDELMRPDDSFWGSGPGNSGPFRVGVPLEVQARLATQTGAALWVNAQPMLGAPQAIRDAAAQGVEADPPGAPNRRTRTDKWRDIARPHAAAIAYSDELLVYARRFVAALDAAGYPRNRVAYVELGNEVWNNAGGFGVVTGYYWGLSEGLRERLGGAGFRKAYGYMSAKLAAAMEQAVSEGEAPREWAVVIGAQTTSTGRTREALDGADAYFKANGGDAARGRLASRFGLATTNYVRGAFDHRRRDNLYGIEDRKQYYRRFLRDLGADPDAHAQRIADWLISHPSGLTVAGLMKSYDAHAEIIADWGGFYLGNYEGGSHDSFRARGGDGLSDAEAKEIAAFAVAWHGSDHNARVTQTFARAFFERFPGAMFANYALQGERRADRPWIETGPGETTAASRLWRELARTVSP